MKLKISVVAAALALGLAPDPVVQPSAWAAENIVVPDGPYAGSHWSPEVTPYLPEILDLLAPEDPATRISVRKSAQPGLTGLGIAWLGYIADVAPARAMAVQPTVDAAKDFNRDKLQPTIDGSPVLRRKIAPLKSRSGRGSTVLSKSYPGGSLTICGANSTAGLRSKTVKNVLCDEIDDWPEDLEGQGDPMLMVDARQLAFRALGTYKKLEMSTPTLKGSSRIDAAFEAGDQRYYHVSCPHCGHEQTLIFENLRFEEDFPHKAVYVCAARGCIIEHFEKTGMLARGRWIAAEPGPGRHPSFHIDSLYSPFVTWDDIAAAYLATKGDPHREKGFANLWLGRSFEVQGEAPKWEDLQKRAQSIASHGRGEVPAWVLFLTMGVDMQADRLEASIWGWGVGKTSALIDHVVLAGNTADLQVWGDLTELWQQSWFTLQGRELRLECTAVDSGYRPTMAYDWVRGKPATISIKGYSGRTDWPIGTPKKMTYTPRGKLVRSSALNWMVGSWYLKAELYGYLNLEGPDETGNFPPGFVHLASGLDDEVFKQLTAEKLVAKQKRGGLTSYQWDKSPQDRNEVLDCAVYARAAAYSPHIGMGRMTLAQWEALAIERGAPPEPAQLDMLRAVVAPPGAEVDEAAPAIRAGKSRWLS
jgi:phage terminase large subunit GpA-like protein